MYLETVDWATSKPSISSSPWIRDAPQFGFSLAYPSDEVTQTPIALWPSCPLSRFPAPERLEARTMPAKNSLRLNHLRGTERARPKLGHTDQLFSERTGPRQAGDLRRSAPTALKPAVFPGPRKLRCLHRATSDLPISYTKALLPRPRSPSPLHLTFEQIFLCA